MGAGSSTWTHRLLQLFFPVLLVAATSSSSHTTTINITNRCSYTVWPAATPVGGGVRLDPGNTWVLQVPSGTVNGRVWARTGCSFDGPGNKSCQTGDCSGVLACKTSGQPPCLGAFNSLDFFDITVIDGFNMPMDFLPVPGSSAAAGAHAAWLTSHRSAPMSSRFTFEQLQEATNQFREELGEGGFGSVFKGRLGEEAIAVKRLDRAGQGKREFLAEVQTIGNIHHINLVRVIGFCAEKSHRLLVYEYMPKGSLDPGADPRGMPGGTQHTLWGSLLLI